MTPRGELPTPGGLDDRVRAYLEADLGAPLASFPVSGVEVRESPKRTDERSNRLCIIRRGDGAVATAIPRVIEVVTPVVRSLTVQELFSPLGLAELRRAMGPEEGESLAHGLDYFLADEREFRPAETPHRLVALMKKEIPPGQRDLRMSERQPPAEAEQKDFVWAFACYHDDAEAVSTELAPFGPRCASIAILIWKSAEVCGYGVGTEEAYRGRGYALAAVAAATREVLARGAAAIYGAFATNIPSLRIPRRLGYRFGWETIGTW